MSPWEVPALFPEALGVGVVASAVAALFGVHVLLRRVVLTALSLAQVAGCGVALALAAGAPPLWGAAALTALAVAGLAGGNGRRVSRDAWLGVLLVGAWAGGVLLVARSPFDRQQVETALYGDLILATRADLWLVLATVLPAGVWLLTCHRPLGFAVLDPDAARVAGVRVAAWDLAWFLALGLVVAVASRAAGALLVFAWLVAPAAAALRLARGMAGVLALAASAAVACTLAGIWLSAVARLPTNAAIGACTVAWFLAVWGVTTVAGCLHLRRRRYRPAPTEPRA